MDAPQLILDYVYGHEAARAGDVLFTQPIGDGRVTDITWGAAMDEARRMAAHLAGLGLAPGARIAILSRNTAHLMIAELAVWMAGGTSVVIFATETAQNVRFVLEHSGASLLFVGKLDAWPAQSAGVPDGLPCIALPLAGATGMPTWASIVARTPPLAGRPARRADELAMILYTSGSTGEPKGVMQTFASVTRAGCGIARSRVERDGADLPSRFISYLPLAHCFERAWIECQALVRGNARVYFADSLATFADDLRRARPTMFISVPRLWEKFRQQVLANVPQEKLDALLADPATADAIRAKILAGLGLDAVTAAGSGSAPIAPALVEWFRRLGLDLREGYGMTEDFAYSHYSARGEYVPGWVGTPFPDVEVRLAEDGEILVRSPAQLAGYYRRPDLDAEAFTEDRFFRTGDLGERREDGQLRIVGRKKDLFKTAKGEYVVPARLESRLTANPIVEVALVSGVGQPAPYALIMLAESLRPQVADAAVHARVTASLAALLASVNDGLPAHEKLRMLVVAREPWTIDNGCLTPTLKIRRARIEERVAARVADWYRSPGPVVWD